MSKIAAMMIVIIAFALATGLSAFLSFRSIMSRSRDRQQAEAREAVENAAGESGDDSKTARSGESAEGSK